jgi:hypothetical protein
MAGIKASLNEIQGKTQKDVQYRKDIPDIAHLFYIIQAEALQ